MKQNGALSFFCLFLFVNVSFIFQKEFFLTYRVSPDNI
jgi:hypothetical protein